MSAVETRAVTSRRRTVDVYRADTRRIELRDAGSATPTLAGHFAVFDQWTEISSAYEGRFMERVAPGAARKTIQNDRAGMRCLFQHGRDPELGDKPIGKIKDLREDATGAYYEVALFPGLAPLVMDGLRAGQYGASFRFNVTHEDVDDSPSAAPHNPMGLPERTIREMKVLEFGPVTWGAYPGATAQIASGEPRMVSLTDVVIDCDKLTRAAPVLLDTQRLGEAQAFISRGIPLVPTPSRGTVTAPLQPLRGAASKPKLKPGQLGALPAERHREPWRLGTRKGAEYRNVAAADQRRVTITKTAQRMIVEECEYWGDTECGGTLLTHESIRSWRPIALTGGTCWDVSRDKRSLGVPRQVTGGKWDKVAGYWHSHPGSNPRLSDPEDVRVAVMLAEEHERDHVASQFVSVVVTPNPATFEWWRPTLTAYLFERTGPYSWEYQPAMIEEA